MKIHTGDTVEIITGKDKGKRGRVRQAMPSEGKVVVEGANIVKRHRKQGIRNARQVGIVEVEAPLQVSNVMIVSPKYGKPRRVGHSYLADGTKVRVLRGGGHEEEELTDRQ